MKLEAGAIAAEAVTVLAGALLAAWVVGQLPELRAWIARQWAGPGCDCGRE